MTKIKKIPTIFGLMVLLAGIAAGVLLINSNKIFSLGAKPETSPKDIRLSNVQSSSVTISWITGKLTESALLWSEKNSSQFKSEIVNQGKASYIHLVNLEDLSPQTSYNFKIVSNGYEYDNEDLPWQFNTGPKLDKTPQAQVVSGTILTSSGANAEGIILYVSVGGSSLLSTKTESDGTWLIPISYARIQDLQSYVLINPSTTLIEITAQGGPLGIASAQIYPEATNPVPAIMLGQTHDFKDLPPQKEGGLPQASVDFPEK